MTMHHSETLRFERQQSRAMREAQWIDRLPRMRPIWTDVLAAIGLNLGLAAAYWLLAKVM